MKKETFETVIIILNWNGLTLTQQCLDALLESNCNNCKVIVIDNGSKEDEAFQIRKKYKNVDVYRLDDNRGFTGGVNYGILMGEKYDPQFFLLLNNDAIVTKGFLNQLIKTALSNKNIGVAGSIIYDLHDQKKILYSGAKMNWLLARPQRKTDFHSSIGHQAYVSGCAMLIKKEVIDTVGLLDETFFAYFEDVAYCMSAAQAGYISVCDTQSVIYHDESSSSGKKSNLYTYLFSRNRIRFIKKVAPQYLYPYYLLFFTAKLIAAFTYFLLSSQLERGLAYLDGYKDGLSNNSKIRYLS